MTADRCSLLAAFTRCQSQCMDRVGVWLCFPIPPFVASYGRAVLYVCGICVCVLSVGESRPPPQHLNHQFTQSWYRKWQHKSFRIKTLELSMMLWRC